MAYVTKVRVKNHGVMLPYGYEFQVVHNNKGMDGGDLQKAAIEEYKKLNGGKTPGTRRLELSYVEIISKP